MDICWRWPLVIGLFAVVGHATSWFGTATPGGRAGPAAELGGLLSGAESLIGQIFAWLFVLIAFELLCCAFGYVIGEIKLRRLYDRPASRWSRPAPTSSPYPPVVSTAGVRTAGIPTPGSTPAVHPAGPPPPGVAPGPG